MPRYHHLLLSFIGFTAITHAQWLPVENTKLEILQSKEAGSYLSISYDLNTDAVAPAYVFIRYKTSDSENWSLLKPTFLQGTGHGIVESPGPNKCAWWGISELGITKLDQVEIKIRALAMARVPGGEFRMKSVPSGGHDVSKPRVDPCFVPTFHIAKNETTIGMYVDYLNETGQSGAGWNVRMTERRRVGIERNSEGEFRALEERDLYPICYVSWYDASSFLNWCGLRLPTEAEWEKSFRGGLFLDGDENKADKNPLPKRRFPWGDENPTQDGIFRCNADGDADGHPYTAPVGSFAKFASPYGINDLSGNVNEWTLDWYKTTHHAGLDGFRMARGGSWMDLPDGVDVISGATSLPNRESGIMGFRGAY